MGYGRRKVLSGCRGKEWDLNEWGGEGENSACPFSRVWWVRWKEETRGWFGQGEKEDVDDCEGRRR